MKKLLHCLPGPNPKAPNNLTNLAVNNLVRGNPLPQPVLDILPLAALNDSWNQVKGPNLLRAGFVALYVEGDPQVEELQISRLLPPLEFSLREGANAGRE